jgi:hypothetical protein
MEFPDIELQNIFLEFTQDDDSERPKKRGKNVDAGDDYGDDTDF